MANIMAKAARNEAVADPDVPRGEEETMTSATRGDASSLFATPKTVAEHRADGSIVLRSPEPLGDCARCIGDWLEHFARQTPDKIFLAERDSADTPWAIVTYAGALRRVRAAATWILAQGLSVERPVPSSSSPTTVSIMRCSRWPPSTSAFPRPRYRRPIR
ncbi:hypothetical protein ACVWYH_003190 [Bradyrhizobium sp. GM24.11]